MIISFDTESSKVILLQQQNDKKSFVVDFLFKRNESDKIFEQAICKLCEDNKILKMLRSEKNTVVLPNQFVSVDNFTVPYEKREMRQYMLSKFDLTYGDKSNFVLYDEIFEKNKNNATFLVYATKSNIVFEILNTFEKFGIKIKSITFESSVFAENVLQENKQYTKENLLIAKVNESCFDFVILTKGRIFAHQKIELDSNQFAKQYAKYVKTNYKKLANTSTLNQKEIEKIKVNSQKNAKKIDYLSVFVQNLQDFYKNSEFKLNFDEIVIVSDNYIIVENNFGTKLSFYKNKGFSSAGKNYFIEQRKGLF